MTLKQILNQKEFLIKDFAKHIILEIVFSVVEIIEEDRI